VARSSRNLLTLPAASATLVGALAVAAGNTAEQIVAFLMIRRLCGSNPFDTARDALRFVAAAILACLVGATNGISVLRSAGLLDPGLFRSAWLTWWVGDMAGMLVLAPALHAWGRKPAVGPATIRLAEAGIIVAATLLGAALIFGGRETPRFIAARPHLLFVVLLWTAFRFGQRETSTLAVLISALAVTLTWNSMRAAYAGGDLRITLAPFVSRDTTPNDWLLALQVYICTTGTVAVVLASAIAERDRSNTAVKESEQRFRTIFEQAAVGVALIETPTGRFCRVNQRCCEIAGLSAEALTATTFQAITHPEDLSQDLAYMKRLVEGDIAQFTIEKRYRRRNGSMVWVNLTVSPTWKPGERPDFHIAIIEDITARKHFEAQLRDMNQALEARVRERTSQLEAALEEKETLLREIHHRVKNNLAVISGLLYLEASNVQDEQVLRLLEESQHRVRSMAMVHEKLYRSGNLSAVNCRDYLEALVIYLVQSYSSTSARVRVETNVDELYLDADTAVPCGLILTELLTNSLKHAFPADRSGTIGITLRNSNGHHILSVSDDGVGLERHEEIESPSTLGLRLVHSLTRQLDGTIAFRATPPGLHAVLQFPSRGELSS
jgi:PAS domain S-box-containing protein